MVTSYKTNALSKHCNTRTIGGIKKTTSIKNKNMFTYALVNNYIQIKTTKAKYNA